MLPTPPDSPIKTSSPLPNEGVGPNDVRVILPTVVTLPAADAKAEEVPHCWMKPFKVDWMLHAICEAQTDNAACAALCIWIHKDHTDEITDKLISELKKGGEPTRERLYELHEPIRYVRYTKDSSETDFMIPIQLDPCTGMQSLTTKALLNSGCTGSTNNRTYVLKHGLKT